MSLVGPKCPSLLKYEPKALFRCFRILPGNLFIFSALPVESRTSEPKSKNCKIHSMKSQVFFHRHKVQHFVLRGVAV